MDIYVPGSDAKIKVFCNYSGSDNLKISSDLETEEGVLYLVVKPTTKNIHGFSCVGGDKSIVDKSIKTFKSENSPKNINIELLRFVSIIKFLGLRSNLLENKQAKPVVTECNYPIIKSACVKSCRIPLVSSYIPKPFSKNFTVQH